MTIQEIVGTLIGFEPGDGFDSPTTEDLARELTQVVAETPGRFMNNISDFDNVGVAYKNGLQRGFRQAAEAGQVNI